MSTLTDVSFDDYDATDDDAFWKWSSLIICQCAAPCSTSESNKTCILCGKSHFRDWKRIICVCREYDQDYLDQHEPNQVCSQCNRSQHDSEFTLKFFAIIDRYERLRDASMIHPTHVVRTFQNC